MGLQVWLPLNKDTRNNGLSNVKPTNNGGTLNTNGVFDKCYHFGTSSSYIKIPPSSMTGFTTACTVSFWLRIKTWNTSYATFFQAGKGNSPWAHYVFGFLRNSSNSTICFTISDSASTSSQSNYLTSAISLNTWYHVVLAYETGKIKIYLNGSIDHQYTTTIVPHFSGITKITLGTSNAISSYQTDCDMNDFRIYDNCLTEEDVKRLYNCKIMDICATDFGSGFFYDNSGLLINKLVSTGLTFSGNSMYFNGTTTQIRPKDGTSGLNISGGTLSVWFTPLSKPSINKIIYIDEKSHMCLAFNNNGNTLFVFCYHSGESWPSLNCYSLNNISWGNINNVIVTYNSNFSPQSCYINGIVPSYSGSSAGLVEQQNKGITIGGRQYNSSNYFNGYISKVTVYRNQLTEDEAKQLYAIGPQTETDFSQIYTRLEYIHSTGTQYIDTGVKPTAQTSVSVKAKLLNLTNGPSFCGSLGTNNANGILIGTSSDGTGVLYVNSSSASIPGVEIEANNIYKISVSGTTVSIQKEEEAVQIIDNTVAVVANNNNIYMIGRNNNGVAQRFGSFNYYYMKIYDNGVLVRDFVPCKNSSNVVGMYDMVTKTFFTNAGTGTFTAGPEI